MNENNANLKKSWKFGYKYYEDTGNSVSALSSEF